MIFTYTAKRSVISGHTAGTQYSIDVPLSDLQYRPAVAGREYRTVGGDEITILHNAHTEFVITSRVIENGGTPDQFAMREFLDSVKGREPFTMDDGSGPVSVIVKSLRAPYRETRIDGLHYRYSFEVIAL